MQATGGTRTATVTVRQRTRWTIPVVAGIAILALGLVTAVGAQPTMSGKIGSVVFFGLFIGLCGFIWVYGNRGRDRVEITPDAISLRPGRGRRGRSAGSSAPPAPSTALTREGGSDLRLIPRLNDHGIAAGPRLTVVGSGGVMTLYGFRLDAVRRGCEAAGWRFGNGTPEQAARDLRELLDSGQVAEAAQLIDVFGPCDWPASADNTTSLSAVVLERYADELSGRDRAAASAAYLRAAAAQRSFAAFATSGGEGTARMAEASRLTGKASQSAG
jgi:hypothetical protein